ncbi:hypothetical protein [Gloeocapsa sp. PCC 73106]|uniref:hypothetical protein n=1 Tax=Gloeocapsa sp. PCC 73106 TaxID=102232 RepID=UPI0002ACED9E|nr:hypothetical protein [Gloeocapsa sp. PCC 73106]ELR97666.1 hypothetical protein GLO73106DRAFT_00014790 [Gloeocapsa sp. PCC 73106]
MINLIFRLTRSLLLTTAFTFSVPIVLTGALFGLLVLVGHVPGCDWLATNGAAQIVGFLSVFGSGYPLQGVIIIGFAFGFVGGLFDLFNFYRYQTMGGQ